MPKAMEQALKKQALKKFGTTQSERAKRYIYGTMMDKKKKMPMKAHNPI